jgi:hypothetical protein
LCRFFFAIWFLLGVVAPPPEGDGAGSPPCVD